MRVISGMYAPKTTFYIILLWWTFSFFFVKFIAANIQLAFKTYKRDCINFNFILFLALTDCNGKAPYIVKSMFPLF